MSTRALVVPSMRMEESLIASSRDRHPPPFPPERTFACVAPCLDKVHNGISLERHWASTLDCVLLCHAYLYATMSHSAEICVLLGNLNCMLGLVQGWLQGRPSRLGLCGLHLHAVATIPGGFTVGADRAVRACPSWGVKKAGIGFFLERRDARLPAVCTQALSRSGRPPPDPNTDRPRHRI